MILMKQIESLYLSKETENSIKEKIWDLRRSNVMWRVESHRAICWDNDKKFDWLTSRLNRVYDMENPWKKK